MCRGEIARAHRNVKTSKRDDGDQRGWSRPIGVYEYAYRTYFVKC